MSPFRSLAVKLTLAFLLIGLAGAVLVAVMIQRSTRTAFDQFVLNKEQQALVDNLAQYYRTNKSWKGIADNFQSFFGGSPRFFDRRGGGEPNRPGALFTLVGPDQTVVLSSGKEKPGQAVAKGDLDRFIALKVDNETVGWVSFPSLPGQAATNEQEMTFLESVNRATLTSALVAVGLAILLGGLLAFTLTRSLRELTEATHQITRGKLGQQVKVRSKDEVGELASAFNRMSQDLAQTTQARRQMTADIAHDLRTPLSILLGYTEALSDGKLEGTPEVFNILHQETQQMNHLVEDLRTLSLADAGELSLLLQSASPPAILERVAVRHSLAVQQKEVKMRVEYAPNLPRVAVDLQRIEQVFDNLISNALRYTPQGGEIVLSGSAQGGRVLMRVTDNGSGIAAEDLPHIFDRFYRADKSRPLNGESGLGLAIAKSIVEAHGGTIRAESTAGQGATFIVSLPSA